MDPQAWVEGQSLHGAPYPPTKQRQTFRRIGQLAAAIHTSAPARPADGMLPLGKLTQHPDGARPHLAPREEELIRTMAEKAAPLPGMGMVPTHGDFQLLH
ncbi:hypothetical protein ACGFYO_08535 [Streptomyces sp. NPDC048201]|uniref:hypothetical protein n=1 Tax=Streptomyces sp. NPDC048201 TaxID=3365513 RepID=UPI00371F7D8D